MHSRYVIDTESKYSSKGKTPWVTLNGVNVADSQLSIEHISQEQNISRRNSHLSPVERAYAHSARIMAEEHLYFCIVIEAYVFQNGKHLFTHYPPNILPLPDFLARLAARTLLKRWIHGWCKAQGLGRHSEEELHGIADNCLHALSNLLSEKKFIGGDAPCDEDCAVFGQLAWLMFAMPKNHYLNAKIRADYPNLVEYVERLKGMYWTDWEDATYKE